MTVTLLAQRRLPNATAVRAVPIVKALELLQELEVLHDAATRLRLRRCRGRRMNAALLKERIEEAMHP